MGAIQDNDDDIISGINITPLVDIMLVLLIIFMLVSTITDFTSIEIELPKAATGDQIKNESLSILISKTGDYYLSGNRMDSFEELKQNLREKKEANPEVQVIISADKKVYHEEIIRVIDAVRNLQIYKFAINVEPAEEAA